jgi:menaquinone-dependent protoporphyrinogen oxidase
MRVAGVASGRRVLVAYASKHGSTEGIAEAIADRLRDIGHVAEARPVQDANPRHVDAVVLGSAIYVGSWMKEATEFAERHADALRRVPTWLFSSGPLGVEVHDEEEQPRQLGDLTDALHPRGHRIFFGALDRHKLGFGERMMVKAVKAPEGDFRDWDAIASWTDEIAESLG